MTDKILDVGAIVKDFPLGRGQYLRAVDHVSLRLHRGEVLGLVGESGSGKSTLARIIARLVKQSDGSVWFNNRDLTHVSGTPFSSAPERRNIQMVFQDPLASLNPRWTVAKSIADPIRQLGNVEEKGSMQTLVEDAAERAGLPKRYLDSYPHQLSGGQRARVDIARAVVLRPKLLILDEPTSALDASLQAHVIQTLMALRQELDLSFIFVTHDLSLVRLISNTTVVMQRGKMVEAGKSAEVFGAPKQPYTRELIDAIPMLGERRR